MKLAVIADVHANVRALDTVIADLTRWAPDQVVVAGDVINRGPRPLECLDLVRAHPEWHVVIGNHEEYVLRQATAEAHSKHWRELFRPSRWTLERIGERQHEIAAWPLQHSVFGPDGGEVRITHASMRHTRDGVFPHTSDAELRLKIGAGAPAAFCVGHTHIPLLRRLDETLVVNSGAVGMPFDGDARASYARLTFRQGQWQAEIIRLAYDRAQAERDFAQSGFLDEAGALARIMLAELRHSTGMLFEWTRDYEAPVLAGMLTIDQSVDRFLAGKGL
jgi:predicted phosphodiesterase